jgi:hypothetical protein
MISFVMVTCTTVFEIIQDRIGKIVQNANASADSTFNAILKPVAVIASAIALVALVGHSASTDDVIRSNFNSQLLAPSFRAWLSLLAHIDDDFEALV